MRRTSVSPPYPWKSTITSARSAGPKSSESSSTGRFRKPPSVPICGGPIAHKMRAKAGQGRKRKRWAGSDLLELGAAGNGQIEEARGAAVEQAEAVGLGLDVEEGPHTAIDHSHIAKELRLPIKGVPELFGLVCGNISFAGVRHRWSRRRVQYLAVLKDDAVLHNNGNLKVPAWEVKLSLVLVSQQIEAFGRLSSC